MTKKIFKSIFTVSVAIAVICFLCVSFVLYAYFEGIVEGELKEEARLISNEVQDDEGLLDRVGSVSYTHLRTKEEKSST